MSGPTTKTLARVVIADDDPIIRMDLREMLTDLNYDVVGEAADGKNAVALAPSFCTFGEQLALDRIDDFDEKVFHQIYDGLKRSGTEVKLLVIDDQWQGKSGSL